MNNELPKAPPVYIDSTGLFKSFQTCYGKKVSQNERLDGPSYISPRGEEWYEFGHPDHYLVIESSGAILYWEIGKRVRMFSGYHSKDDDEIPKE